MKIMTDAYRENISSKLNSIYPITLIKQAWPNVWKINLHQNKYPLYTEIIIMGAINWYVHYIGLRKILNVIILHRSN